MMATSVIITPARDGIAERALDLLVDGLRAGIRDRGSAHLALTGGSSASALFSRLRTDPRAGRVDWSRVHVWQGDERFVPADDPDRNWTVARAEWLAAEGVPRIPEEHLHPVPVDTALAAGQDAAAAAAAYGEQLRESLPQRDGLPSFDVLLLGVGSDGHILSAFPGSAPVVEEQQPVMAVPAPTHIGPHVPRVTLTPALLAAAGIVIVMVPGGAKAPVVAECLRTRTDPLDLPAVLAVRPNAAWLLETASAASV